MTQAAMDNDTMVEVTLKPCPFCGSTWVGMNKPANGSAKSIKCRSCNAGGPLAASFDEAQIIAAWNARHQSGRTGAGERETVARVIHQCLRPVNMANADWDSGAILGADNSWRRSVYSTADHILAALSQSTAGEDGA